MVEPKEYPDARRPLRGEPIRGEIVDDDADEPRRRPLAGKLVASSGAMLAAVYMLNFTFGVFELPDNLPIVGNLDEAAAMAILMSCLGYLGIHLPFLSAHARRKERRPAERD